MTQNVQSGVFLFCFGLVLSFVTLTSVSVSVFKRPITKSFLFTIEFLIIYMQPLQNCLKAFKYIAGCFVLQQGSEISQCTDSSSVHKWLIKPPSFTLKMKGHLSDVRFVTAQGLGSFLLQHTNVGWWVSIKCWFTELANTEERKNSQEPSVSSIARVCICDDNAVLDSGPEHWVCTTTAAWL